MKRLLFFSVCGLSISHIQHRPGQDLTDSTGKDTMVTFRLRQFSTYIDTERRISRKCQLPVVLVPHAKKDDMETKGDQMIATCMSCGHPIAGRPSLGCH